MGDGRNEVVNIALHNVTNADTQYGQFHLISRSKCMNKAKRKDNLQRSIGS